jgi:hypothetical protein
MTDTNEWLHRQPVQLIGVQEFERLPGPSRANLARYVFPLVGIGYAFFERCFSD